jgi:hypothetical protein
LKRITGVSTTRDAVMNWRTGEAPDRRCSRAIRSLHGGTWTVVAISGARSNDRADLGSNRFRDDRIRLANQIIWRTALTLAAWLNILFRIEIESQSQVSTTSGSTLVPSSLPPRLDGDQRVTRAARPVARLGCGHRRLGVRETASPGLRPRLRREAGNHGRRGEPTTVAAVTRPFILRFRRALRAVLNARQSVEPASFQFRRWRRGARPRAERNPVRAPPAVPWA